MALEYSDDNELVYQAKQAARDIVNAKYEVTKKVGDFLFLAHSDEEFYQRAAVVDSILDSTSTRRLASVSDSKAKLVKALFQEWELKHASCESCGSENFKLAFPITPTEQTAAGAGPTRRGRLWDRWSLIKKNPEPKGPAFLRTTLQDTSRNKGLTDQLVASSVGRLDDPEVEKKFVPGSVVWFDQYGLYGRDKKPNFDSVRGKKQQPETDRAADLTNFISMMGRAVGRRDLGNQGLIYTHHRCTGQSFRGYDDNQTGVFPQCTHIHHEGDGCGVGVNEKAPEGSVQPGCNKPHVVVTALTPQLFVDPPEKEGDTPKFSPIPDLRDEVPDPDKTPADISAAVKNAVRPEQGEAVGYKPPTHEQVGEPPLDRLFLMSPEVADMADEFVNRYHRSHGGTGDHPSTLDQFQIGGKTYRVGDIVAVPKGRGQRGPEMSPHLGIVVGTSVHQNGQYTRFDMNNGRVPNTNNDLSAASSTPGEYSLLVHRLHAPKSGGSTPNAIDPSSNQIIGGVNEATQYFPSSQVETIEPFSAKSLGKKPPTGPGSLMSRMYGRLKAVQAVRNAKPQKVRTEKPRTVNKSNPISNISMEDLNALFTQNQPDS